MAEASLRAAAENLDSAGPAGLEQLLQEATRNGIEEAELQAGALGFR